MINREISLFENFPCGSIILPHPVFPRAHGNSKNEKPYARSLKLTRKVKIEWGKATTKEALTQTLEKSGGLVHARSAGSILKITVR